MGQIKLFKPDSDILVHGTLIGPIDQHNFRISQFQMLEKFKLLAQIIDTISFIESQVNKHSRGAV